MLRLSKRNGGEMSKPPIAAMILSSLAMGAIANTMQSQSAPASVSIMHGGSHPATAGSKEYFTGNVRIDSQFQRDEPARVSGAMVTFEPAARTAWHTHPLGQTLIVTAGTGWVRQWRGSIQEIRRGDVVWIPPGVKHWHGATATDHMTHIAIQESLDGKNVQWMEHVTRSSVLEAAHE
jgi:4-carboxymuconolactone decarboxylase